jgi:adenosine deaminase
MRELAAEAGTTVPPVRPYRTFSDFMAMITAAQSVIGSIDDLRRVVAEVVEDAAVAGARWVELSLWPGCLGGRLGPDDELLAIVVEAGRAAAAVHDVGFGLMVAANRDCGPEAALHTAEQAVRFAGRGVVSFGLDGDEARYPRAPFAGAFSLAQEAGLVSAPHAGEFAGPPSVLAALDALAADRIGHGVRAVEDPALVRRLAADGVCLDVCPTSNVRLGVVTAMEAHPLLRLLESGVRCSVNADDPLLFGSGLLDEYVVCREVLGLDDEVLSTIAATSLTASAAPSEIVAHGLAGIRAWLAGTGA